MPPPSIVALEGVTRAHGTRVLLDDITLGVAQGSRVGVVGRNGAGKSTLLQVLAGSLPVDAGRVVRVGGVSVGVLRQDDSFPAGATLADVALRGRPDHVWAADPRIRDVVVDLLGGLSAPSYPEGMATAVATMSGGERRRAALTGLLVDAPDLLLLDEPTNHLDIEAVDALARQLRALKGTVVAITHDRWFLDAVCDETWEVAGGRVHRYDGGYAAYVLARAERERVSAVTEERRRNLLRKELAWLRRGPPARTSKPKFRIDAAEALVAGEPPPRDRMALQRFTTQRLGRTVVDLEDVTVRAAESPEAPVVLRRQTFRLGPGDRVGLLGPNGAGKTTLMRVLAGGGGAVDGRVRIGATVAAALLSQQPGEIDPDDRVLTSLERVRSTLQLADGRERSARQLLEEFGFSGDRLWTRLGDLSGGERRRLQLLALLAGEPNLLLLDEPTNDLDVETLTVLEDLLDSWPGSVVVVSHDRYLLERVCDDLYALPGDGSLRHLPGGVAEYLQLRAAVVAASGRADPSPADGEGSDASVIDQRAIREARKELTRLERRLDRLRAQESALHAELAAHAADHATVLRLDADLRAVLAERDETELQWLELAERLEG